MTCDMDDILYLAHKEHKYSYYNYWKIAYSCVTERN